MWKKLIRIIIILLTYIILCNIIYRSFSVEENKISTSINVLNPKKVIKNITKDNSIGNLKINKISLNKKLYTINSK